MEDEAFGWHNTMEIMSIKASINVDVIIENLRMKYEGQT